MTFVSNIMNLKAYYILDELIVAGELQESSTRTVLQQIVAHVFLLMVFLFFFFPLHFYEFYMICIVEIPRRM